MQTTYIIKLSGYYNKDFISSHPNIVVENKSDSSDGDKSAHDSKLLIPLNEKSGLENHDFSMLSPMILPCQ